MILLVFVVLLLLLLFMSSFLVSKSNRTCFVLLVGLHSDSLAHMPDEHIISEFKINDGCCCWTVSVGC